MSTENKNQLWRCCRARCRWIGYSDQKNTRLLTDGIGGWEEVCPRCGCNEFYEVLDKPYGWDVVVEFHDGTTKEFHFVGSERAAKRKSMLKTLARRILSAKPLTREAWKRVYGTPGIRT